MEIWMYITMGLSLVGGFLIKKFELGSWITSFFSKANEIKDAISNLYDVISDSVHEDSEGGVNRTADEWTAVKNAIDEILVIFGEALPW